MSGDAAGMSACATSYPADTYEWHKAPPCASGRRPDKFPSCARTHKAEPYATAFTAAVAAISPDSPWPR